MIEDGSDTILGADAIIDADGEGSLATIQDRTRAVRDGQADDAVTDRRQDEFPSPAPVFLHHWQSLARIATIAFAGRSWPRPCAVIAMDYVESL